MPTTTSVRTTAGGLARRAGEAVALRSTTVARQLVRRKIDRGLPRMWDMRFMGLLPPGRLAVDVGAHIGMCTLPLCERFDLVVAFEPNRGAAQRLLRVAPSNAVVLTAAGGDAPGIQTLYSPVEHTREVAALSSLVATAGDTSSRVGSPTLVLTLDGLGLGHVDFVKIDVEGHELAVLEGARETLARSMPVLLLEAEERHSAGSPAAVAALLSEAGYAGYFVHGVDVVEVAEFDAGRHQHRDGEGTYANNFAYVPAARAAEYRALLERAAATGGREGY
jgi:FkbM family methyltransferase